MARLGHSCVIYMGCLEPRRVSKQREAPGGRDGMAADGPTSCGANDDAAPRTIGPTGRAGSVLGGMQQPIGVPPQGRSSARATDTTARSVSAAELRSLCARPELDDNRIGGYMRDAIGRGGYRAALEYYDSDDAAESDTPWHRLRAKGWLLGRLGLYDRVQSWLEEVVALPDFDHLSHALKSRPSAPCRTPALWLETPRPVPRSTDHILTVEPVATAGPDIREVPDYIWTLMLILDAAGPVCSRAGIGAAMSLVAADSDRRMAGTARRDRRYDPLRGARLHGAPEGCHRWIIADIDFDPRPVNKPHYYYDLTDEGRRTLDAARRADAPWPSAVGAAASGLEGMTLPDMLEGACGLGGMRQDLDGMRRDLGRIVRAWRDQAGGRRASPVSPEDQAFVDLGPPTKWHGIDDGTGSTLDHLLYLMTAIKTTHKVACEANPASDAEKAVLEALIEAIRDMCRRHGREVAANASLAGAPPGSSHGGAADSPAALPRWPLYADATPVLISDLYYCLAEYCTSRSLAVDPRSLPLSEQLADDAKAVAIEALERDSPYRGGADRSRRGG